MSSSAPWAPSKRIRLSASHGVEQVGGRVADVAASAARRIAQYSCEDLARRRARFARRRGRSRRTSASWPRRSAAIRSRKFGRDTGRPAGRRTSGRPCRDSRGRCRASWCRWPRPPVQRSSSRRSSSKCQGKITWARSLIIRLLPTSTAAAGQAVDLGQEAGRVEHHAAGDHALDLRAEDAAGDQRELVGLAAGDDRVARRWPRPDSGRRCRAARSAGRRSCPWLRRPTADRSHT